MTPPATSALNRTLKQLAANAHGAKLGCDTDARDSARHRMLLFRRDDDSDYLTPEEALAMDIIDELPADLEPR